MCFLWGGNVRETIFNTNVIPQQNGDRGNGELIEGCTLFHEGRLLASPKGERRVHQGEPPLYQGGSPSSKKRDKSCGSQRGGEGVREEICVLYPL